ncbi:LppU/SCO3897 family protein [Actinomadura rifamycini]|uniref:LppU/SCO3897 family protein n=1 Tax=Actinomadura rifamycini TaxID=31962 RepID=UPI00047C6A78|nr:hypothetical protein [Actinomadura rifamycini]
MRGTWYLVACALFFAVVVLPRLWEENPREAALGGLDAAAVPSPGAAAPAPGTPDDGAAGTGPDTGSDGAAEPSPGTPPALVPGTCLAVDHGEDEWSNRPARQVGCGSTGAFYRVTENADGAGDCPDDYEDTWLPYRSGGAACLTREFQIGQCMPVERTGGTHVRIDLRTSIDCRAEYVPDGMDGIHQITGVYRAPSARRAGECSRAAYDSTDYWGWRVRDDEVLVCTAFAD